MSVLALPGIRVTTATTAADEGLPRMDIPAFVGFAARGPLHRPVAIDSVAQWTAVFGADAPLAWDAQRNERAHAHLGPTVRAFFANGGQRCWVVRVARTRALEALWRQLPPRRVPGRDLAVANRYPLPGMLAWVGDSPHQANVRAAIGQASSLGAWSDGVRVAAALGTAPFAVEAIEAVAGGGLRLRFRGELRAGDLVQLGQRDDPQALIAYARIDTVPLPQWAHATLHAAFAPLAAGTTGEGGVRFPGRAHNTASAALQAGSTGQATLQLRDVQAGEVVAGQWARWRRGGLAAPVVWLRMDQVSPTSAESQAQAAGPAWEELPAPRLALLAAGSWSGSRLTLELQVTDGSGGHWRLPGLGLTPGHPASWWRRISDDAQAASATFDGDDTCPLVALGPPAAANAALALLPLGLGPAFGAAAAALPPAATALERDGLSRFDAELFLDPALAALSVRTLMAEADRIRYTDPVPRTLFGAHAVLAAAPAGAPLEPSLICLPDAGHPGWQRRASRQPSAPRPAASVRPGHWSTHRGPCTPAVAPGVLDAPDFSGFIDSATRKLDAPILQGPSTATTPGPRKWSWSSSAPQAVYTLFEAVRSDLSDARIVYQGAAQECEIEVTRPGVYYYAARAALGDEPSALSNVVTLVVGAEAWQLADTDAAATVLAVHAALLRLCAASGDLLALLSLPRRWRSAEAAQHAWQLRRGETALDDLHASLSYGALYHPWLAFAGDGAPTPCPPDGFVAGLAATRSAQRGAWVAPANEPLRAAVALAPPAEERDYLPLQEAQVNLVRADARGLLLLSAHTLSNDVASRPLNVRRLLMLLRRLALRRGAGYVFEPNGDALRRAVERAFEGLLHGLFQRGAFAGATAAECFRVVTPDPPASGSDRLLVELRVAPALPLQFLTLRLAQTGDQLSLAEAP